MKIRLTLSSQIQADDGDVLISLSGTTCNFILPDHWKGFIVLIDPALETVVSTRDNIVYCKKQTAAIFITALPAFRQVLIQKIVPMGEGANSEMLLPFWTKLGKDPVFIEKIHFGLLLLLQIVLHWVSYQVSCAKIPL